jgi:hypothetical protein
MHLFVGGWAVLGGWLHCLADVHLWVLILKLISALHKFSLLKSHAKSSDASVNELNARTHSSGLSRLFSLNSSLWTSLWSLLKSPMLTSYV